MSEFNIKVNVKLNEADLKNQLSKLDDLELNLDSAFDGIKAQLKVIKQSFSEAFKINSATISDITKVQNTLKNIGDSASSSTKSSSSLLNEYKTLYNTIQKIQSQLNKGGLGEDAIGRTKKQIEELTAQMKKVEDAMSNDMGALNAVNNFKAQQAIKELAEINNAFNKIDTQANELEASLKGMDWNFFKDSDELTKIESKINEIKSAVKELDGNIDSVDLGNLINDLSKLDTVISNFKEIEKIGISFDEIRNAASGVGKDVQELDNIFNQLVSSAKSFDGSFESSLSNAKSTVQSLTTEIKALNQAQKEMEKANAAQALSENNQLITQYKELYNVVQKYQKQLNQGLGDDSSISRTKQQIEQLNAEMQKLYNQMDSGAQKKIDLFNAKKLNAEMVELNNTMNKITSEITSLESRFANLSFKDMDNEELEKVKNTIQEIKNIAQGDLDLNIDVGDLRDKLNQIEQAIDNLEKVDRIATQFVEVRSEASQLNVEIGQTDDLVDNLVSSASRLDDSFVNSLSSANRVINEMGNNLRRLRSETGGVGIFDSIMDGFGISTAGGLKMGLITKGVDMAIDGLRQMVSAWKEVVVETDAAITELMKVAPESFSGQGEQLSSYLKQVAEVAKSTGAETVEAIEGTAKALQMGIDNMNDALEYAKSATIFSTVGDMAQEQADTMLASIMSAYGGVEQALQPVRVQVKGMSEDYNNLTNFIDQANYAGNNFAISTADVGEALSRSANALQANGVAMEESIAMIIGMNEAVQDAGKSGNALKTISANMAGVTTSLKDGTIESNKTAKALKELANIDVWNKQTGEIKNMYQVMNELAAVYDKLSEAEKNALGTAIAGKTQLNTFNALISNWKTVTQYVEEYNKGLTVGSSLAENERYLDSIAGKWNVINENVKLVANTIVNSDMAKGILDMGVALSEGLVTATETAMESASSIIDKGLGETLKNSFHNALDGIDMTSIASKIKGELEQVFGEVRTPLEQMITGVLDKFADNSFWSKFKTTASEAVNFFGKAMEEGINRTFPALDALTEKFRAIREEAKLDDSITDRTGLIQSLEAEVKSLESARSKVLELAPAYEELANKAQRTAEEEQKLAECRRQLAEISPESVLGYTKDGEAILKSTQAITAELERQISLKQQTQRLEENSLSMELQQRRLENLKEYNKVLEESANLAVTYAEKQREGFLGIGDESFEEYVGRVIEANEKLVRSNQEAYSKRLADFQTYVAEEKAIQEKYINQMELSTMFDKMAEDAKAGMLTVMDALDWSNFTDTQAVAFTNELAKIGDKIVETTAKMGDHGKAINELEQAYANGQTNLISYTEGLTKAYEATGKLDAESLNQWVSAVQSYGNLTGDLNGVNACIEEMAQSMEKLTGIDAENWKTALTFDYAPIDASNQALQRFLNTYNTGIQNIGKGGLADNLVEQFQNLQVTYDQLLNDIFSNGQESIDVEYLLNFKLNQPVPIQTLIDEIVEDGVVDEKEVPILVNAIMEVLNKGEISSETMSQIEEALGMSKGELEHKINVTAKVNGNMEEVEKYIEQWDGLSDTEKELVLNALVNGNTEFKEAIAKWDTLSDEEKKQTLKQFVEKNGDVNETNKKFTEIEEKEKKQTLKHEVKEEGNIEEKNKEFKEVKEEEKEQTLKHKAEGSDIIQGAINLWNSVPNGEQKEETLEQNVEKNGDIKETAQEFKNAPEGEKKADYKVTSSGKKEIEDTKKAIEETPDKKEIKVSIVQSGKNLLDSIANWFNSKSKQKVEVEAKVSGEKAVKNLNEAIEKLKDKTVKILADSSNAMSKIENVSSSLDNLNDKNFKILADSSNAMTKISTVSTSLTNINDKTVKILADSSNAMSKVANVTTGLNGIADKTVKILADSSNAMAKIANVTASLNSIADRTVKILADSSNAMAKIANVKSGLAGIPDKTVKILADSSNAMSKIANVKSGLAGIKDKTFKILADSSNAMAKINNVKNALNSLQSKTISLNVNKTTTEKKVVVNLPTQNASVQAMAPSSLNQSMPMMMAGEGATAMPMVSALATSSSTINPSNVLTSLFGGVDIFAQMNTSLSNLANQLDIIDKKAQNAFGEEKIGYLEKQIDLYKEQQEQQKELADGLKKAQNEYKYYLSLKGFKFDSSGQILNQTEKLLAYEKELSALEKKSNAKNASEAIKKQYEAKRTEIEKTKNVLDEYLNLTFTEIPNASKEYLDLQKSIADTTEATRELNREMKLTPFQNSIQETDYLLDRHNDRLDLIDAKMQNAFGADLVNLQNQKLDVQHEKLVAIEQMYQRIKQLQRSMIPELNNYGFKIDENGLIGNYDEVLNKAVGTENFEYMKKIADEYMQLVRGDLIDIQIEAENTKYAIESMVQEMEQAKKEAEKAEKEAKLNPYKDALQEIEYLLDRHNDRLSLLESESANAFGAVKLKYLNREMGILQEKLGAVNKSYQSMKNLAGAMQNNLWEYGFSIDENGLIENYDEVLSYLNRTEEYEDAKKAADEYMQLVRGDLIDIQIEANDTETAMKELAREIRTLEREQATFADRTRLEVLNRDYDLLSSKLSIIENQMEYAYGTDKIDLMTKKIGLLNEQVANQEKQIESVRRQMAAYQGDLGNFGFTFDSRGDITNYEELMNHYKDTEDWEEISQLVEEYFDLQSSELNGLVESYEQLQKEIKDAYRAQLDVTKEIEGEITAIYEKEYERRKKLIEDYTNKRIEILNKELEAYQNLREEQDYEKSINEQISDLEDIRKKIETARKDSSLAGQKKLNELLKEQADLEEALKQATQDKIDSDYEKGIQGEIDKLGEQQDKLLGALEEQFSETNIAKMVSEALTSGFVEINGEVQTLQSALLESINDSADAYSVMADVIKNELVANLEVALRTMNELKGINEILSLDDVSGAINSQEIREALDLNNFEKMKTNTAQPISIDTSGGKNSIAIGETNIVVNGDVSSETIAMIEDLIDKKNNQLLNKLANEL